MAVFNEKLGFSYFAVPKVACTSIKLLAFEIENGFAFKAFKANGIVRHIHNFYPTLPIDIAMSKSLKGQERIALVRDPVARFLSAYSNRVLHHGELSQDKLGKSRHGVGLAPRPDLATFVENLETYRTASASIQHHTEPHTFFLGKEIGYFDRLFSMRELPELEAWLCQKTGLDLHLPHEQRGGPKIDPSALSPAHLNKVKQFYAEDIEIFGHLF